MSATTTANPTTPPPPLATTNKQQSRRLKIVLLLVALIGYEFIVENFGSNKDYSISSIATWTTISTTSTESSISTTNSTTTTSNYTINRYGNNSSPKDSNHGTIGSGGSSSDKHEILILNGTGNNDANTMSSRHVNNGSSQNASSPSFSSPALSNLSLMVFAETTTREKTDGNGSGATSSTVTTLPPIPNAIDANINSSTTDDSSRNNNNMTFPALDRHENQSTNDINSNETPTAPLVTIFVQLKGELGNHLSVWIHAKGMQYFLQDHYGIQSQLKFLHQMTGRGHVNGKKKPTQYRIQHCFPKLWLELVASGGSQSSTTYTELIEATQQQKEFFDSISSSKPKSAKTAYSTTTNGENPSLTYTTEELSTLLTHVKNLNNGKLSYKSDTIPNGLHAFVQLVKYKQQLEQQQKQQDHPTTNDKTDTNNNNTVSIPYLLAETLSFTRYMMDTYHEKMLDYFQFNYTNPICCGVLPYPNETVFHFRNFQKEMPKVAHKGGFKEVTANQTAHELLGHLQPGENVGIVTRFPQADDVQEYVTVLQQERKFQVRVIQNHTNDIQDFCFMVKAKRGLVGTAKSTFVKWAGYIGPSIERAILTIVDYHANIDKIEKDIRDELYGQRWQNNTKNATSATPDKEDRADMLKQYYGYNFTNPALRQRIEYRVFQLE